MTMIMRRKYGGSFYTTGNLYLETDGQKFMCSTLELPWKDNQRNISCIPAGTYEVAKRTHGRYYEAYKKRFGHKFSLELKNVSGRGDILIHTGNTKEHTRGCILVGSGLYKNHAGNHRLYNSRWSYRELVMFLEASKEPWYLEIRDSQEDESEDVGDRSDL